MLFKHTPVTAGLFRRYTHCKLPPRNTALASSRDARRPDIIEAAVRAKCRQSRPDAKCEGVRRIQLDFQNPPPDGVRTASGTTFPPGDTSGQRIEIERTLRLTRLLPSRNGEKDQLQVDPRPWRRAGLNNAYWRERTRSTSARVSGDGSAAYSSARRRAK